MLEHRTYNKSSHWDGHLSLQTKQIITAVFMGFLIYAVAYLTSIIVARVLGAKIYGDYAATISALMMIAGFSLLGADFGLGRFIPKYLKEEDYAAISGYIRYSGKWILFLALFIIVVGLLAMIILYHLTGEHILNIHHTHPFYFFIWGASLLAFLIYIGKFIRASGYSTLSLVVINLLCPLLALSTLSIFLIFIRKFTVAEALIIYFFATLGAVLTGLFFAHRKTKLTMLLTQIPRFEPASWQEMMRNFYFLSIATAYMSAILILVSAIFDPNPRTPGFVAAVISITSLFWTINGAIYSTLLPKITVAVVEKDRIAIISLLRYGILANGLVNGALYLVMLIWGRKWLMHFGPEFNAAYPLLVLIGGAVLLVVISTPLAWVFQQSAYLKAYLNFSVVLLILYLIICSLAAHFLGGLAAIWVYVVVQLSHVIYLIILAIRNWNNPKIIKA